MKSNTIIAAGTALVLALILNNSRAQDNAPAPVPAPTPPAAGPRPGQPVPPGFGGGPNSRPMPPRMRQPRMFVMRAQNDLKQVKMALQGAQEDYGGHKASAIAACDKALEEFDALIKAMPQLPNPVQRPGGPASGQYQQNLTPVPPPGGNPPAQAPVAPSVKTPEP